MVYLLTDKRLTKVHASQYFDQLKDSEYQFPLILYNTGVFLLNYDDNHGALEMFKRYRGRVSGKNRPDEMISLVLLLQEDYEKCLKTIKRSIMREPNNLKHRYQLAYVT